MQSFPVYSQWILPSTLVDWNDDTSLQHHDIVHHGIKKYRNLSNLSLATKYLHPHCLSDLVVHRLTLSQLFAICSSPSQESFWLVLRDFQHLSKLNMQHTFVHRDNSKYHPETEAFPIRKYLLSYLGQHFSNLCNLTAYPLSSVIFSHSQHPISGMK